MADEGFEDWDADFLEKVIQVEELTIAATQSKPPPPPPPLKPPQQQPLPLPSHQSIRLGYAHEAFNTCYSPPRDLSQRPITSKETEYDNRMSVRQPTNGVAAVSPVMRSSRSARGGGSGSDSEISKLKKELERVTKLLSKREHECLELRKEREKKKVQLQSATFPKEARSSKAYNLRNSNLILLEYLHVV